MADQNNQGENKLNETTERSSTDVLDMNGNDISSNNTPLARIFDRIESGETSDEAIKKVMAPKDEPEPKEDAVAAPPAAEEKQSAPKEEVAETKQETPDNKKEEGRRDIFEKKKEEKKDEKKAEDEVTEEDLRVLPYDKPKTAKRIDALLKKATALQESEALTKKELAARDQKLKELEEELGKVKTVNPETNEEVKKQLDELSMFRRRYQLENDPEVKQKFDSRIESAENAISEIFKRRGGGDGLSNIVSEEGGWLKFTDSNRVIRLVDGTEMTAAEIAEAIKKELPLSERRAIESFELEQIQTRRDRERFFEEETKKANEFFQKKNELTKKQEEERAKAIEEGSKMINSWREEVKKANDWLKEKDIPSGIPQDKVAEIMEDNKYTKQLNELIDKAIQTTEPKQMLDIVLDSVKLHQERREHAKTQKALQALQQQLSAKEEQIKKFKIGSTTVSKSGSLVGGGSGAMDVTPSKPKTLEEALDAIARGERD